MNNVVLIGRLTRDPELRFVPSSGMAIAKFTLAVDKDLSKEKKEAAASKGNSTADFIQITIFGKQAENCANYLSKGRECAVFGRISTGSYTTQDGEKRYTTDVIATRIEFIGGRSGGKTGENTGENTANNAKPNIDTPPADTNTPNDDHVDDSYFEHLNGDDFDDEDIPF